MNLIYDVLFGITILPNPLLKICRLDPLFDCSVDLVEEGTVELFVASIGLIASYDIDIALLLKNDVMYLVLSRTGSVILFIVMSLTTF